MLRVCRVINYIQTNSGICSVIVHFMAKKSLKTYLAIHIIQTLINVMLHPIKCLPKNLINVDGGEKKLFKIQNQFDFL